MNEFRQRNCIRNKNKNPYQLVVFIGCNQPLPTASVAPNTDEKLLSDTNAFATGAEMIDKCKRAVSNANLNKAMASIITS